MGNNVGAAISRPAVPCCHFAEICGESDLPAARAANSRPYIHAVTLCVSMLI